MALPWEKTPNKVKDSSALEKATLMRKYDTHLENISVLQINMIFKKYSFITLKTLTTYETLKYPIPGLK